LSPKSLPDPAGHIEVLLEQAYRMLVDGGPNIIGGVVSLVIDCPTGQVAHEKQLGKSLQIKPV
jgi:hypothetical protein